MNNNDVGRVVLWMSGALLSFSMMAVSIRELNHVLNVFETLSLRSASGIVILLLIALLKPEFRPGLGTRRVPLHLFRNTVNFLGQASWAWGVIVLPFATVFALEFTTPMWVALLAALVLHERLSTSRVGTVLLGFAGVLVIVRPGLASFQPEALLVLGSALCFATTSIVTKKLITTEATFTILFWMNLVQLPLNLVGSDPLFITKLGLAQALPVLGIVISGLASHFCLTNAFRAGDAIVVMPLDFLRIPLIALIGWGFYGEKLDILVFLGAGLIIAGIVWNLFDEARRRAPAR
jgi:drug/metabolite transporter (DMT)-like permease